MAVAAMVLIVLIADRINPCTTITAAKVSASPCDLLIESLLAVCFAALEHHSNFSVDMPTFTAGIAALVMAITVFFEVVNHLVVL